MPKYDWPLIKAEYVEGLLDSEGNRAFPTLPDLAEKHRINMGTLKNRCSRETWLSERDLFVTKVEEARKEQKINLLAGKSAAFDAKTLKIADAGLSLIAKKLTESVTGASPLGASDHASLSIALKNYQQVGRLALGESTDNQGGFGGGTLIANKIEVVFREENGRD